MATLVEVATAWSQGETTLDELVAHVSKVEAPVAHYDADGLWYEGEEGNSMTAVRAVLTPEAFAEFSRALEERA